MHRQADGVSVLFLGGGHDRRSGLAQAEVDDLHAGVTENAGDDLDAAVVAVEAELRQHHANGRLLCVGGFDSHQTIACST